VQTTILQPQQLPARPVNPAPPQHTTSSDEANLLQTQEPLFCHFPEAIYVSNLLPTRTPRELDQFKRHCCLQYDTHRQTLLLERPLDHVREITPNALTFENLLWRARTTVAHFGVTEEYFWIRRQVRRHIIDRAILVPAYKVFYAWDSASWHTTILPSNYR